MNNRIVNYFRYANKLKKSLDNYYISINEEDEVTGEKIISAKIEEFDCHLRDGCIVSSGIMPNVEDILNDAVSAYLTDNFDEVINFSFDYIMNRISYSSSKEELNENIQELKDILDIIGEK